MAAWFWVGSRGTVRRVIARETIDQAGRLLAAAAPIGSTVILFGSHARGDAVDDSDLDFLVVEPLVGGRADEMVRLRDVLDPLKVAADVVVTSHEDAQRWGQVPGTMLFNALAEGQVLART
jgi:uncharacterized protein